MRTSLSIFASILLLAGQAHAFNSYVGCLTYEGIADAVNIHLSSATLPSRTGAGCAAGCAAENDGSEYGYSAYDAGASDCLCLLYGGPSGSQPDFMAPSTWSTAADAAGTCQPGDFDVYRLSSAWESSATKCYSRYAVVAPNTRIAPAANLGACFIRCGSYPVMTFTPQSDGGFTCQCMSGVIRTVSSTCAQDAYFFYGRSAEAAAVAPSGAYRRSIKEEAKRQLARQKSKFPYCPEPLQACKIAGSVDNYECMDTKYELESCGGCATGLYGVQSNSTGTDCTRISGVPMGAISCLEGKCVAYACKSGWTLKDGVCTKA